MSVDKNAALLRGEAKHRVAWIYRDCCIGRGDGNKNVIIFSISCDGMYTRPGGQIADKFSRVGIDDADRLRSTAGGIEAIVTRVIPNLIGPMSLVNCCDGFSCKPIDYDVRFPASATNQQMLGWTQC